LEEVQDPQSARNIVFFALEIQAIREQNHALAVLCKEL
jgi:hypothetical protein